MFTWLTVISLVCFLPSMFGMLAVFASDADKPLTALARSCHFLPPDKPDKSAGNTGAPRQALGQEGQNHQPGQWSGQSYQPNAGSGVVKASKGFTLSYERRVEDRALIVKLVIPGDAQIAFDQVLESCRQIADQIGWSIANLPEQLDTGVKNLDHAGNGRSALINPAVASATSYCSHLVTSLAPQTRVKTIAER